MDQDAIESKWQTNERRLNEIAAMSGLGRELHAAESVLRTPTRIRSPVLRGLKGLGPASAAGLALRRMLAWTPAT
jgi:hypothetical protein